MERNRRLHYMETVAKQELMESIIDTELVEIHHDFEDVHQDTVTAEIIVGVKSDKPIEEMAGCTANNRLLTARISITAEKNIALR